MTKNIPLKSSIRWKLLFTMLGLIIGLLAALTSVQIYSQKGVMENDIQNRISLIKENLKERGKILSDSLAFQVEEALASFNLLGVINTANKLVKEKEDLRYVILMNASGTALIHTLKPELQESVLDGKQDHFAREQDSATINEFEENGIPYMEFIMPIRVGTDVWGVLRLGYSLENLHRVIIASRRNIKKQTLHIVARSVITTLVFVFIGSGIVLFLSTRFTKPLINLTKSARELARGNFLAAEGIVVKSKDEVGILAKSFIEMSLNLKDSYEKLEDRVTERTSELSRSNELLREEINERRRIEAELEKAREAAVAASKAKSEFLASMSHEIRTPMNVIIGMADLLGETQLSPEQAEYVNIFRTAGDNLLQIINNVLDLSKVEAGQIKLECLPFNLPELVNKTCEMMAFQVYEKGLAFNYRVSSDVPAFLVGDAVRLRQILINLIGNAVKFTEKGEITLNVRKDPDSQQAGALLFSVSDTGIGIPEDKQGVIFESFSQADSSITRKYGGTGLGLAIAKQLVDLMGGRIWVESNVGRGSIFYFTLKLGVSAEVPSPGKPETGENELQSFYKDQKPLRVLLVEDYLTNRIVIQSYLKKTPYQIDVAENGAVCVRKFQSGKYDLILMDVQMPVMDGYTAARNIRKFEREQGMEPTPIIALTAHALKEDVQKSIEAGCNAHLAKPVKKQELLKAIQEHTLHKAQIGHVDDAPPGRAGVDVAHQEKAIVQVNAEFEAFIPEFFETLRKDIASMRTALQNNNLETIQRLAHNIKGAGGGFGFHDITTVGRRLESEAKNKHYENILHLLDELLKYLDNVRIVYVEEKL